MITPAAPSTESFGLPEAVPHLIAKLRNLPPELLAAIQNRADQDVAA